MTRRSTGFSYSVEPDLVFCRPDGNGRDPDVVSYQFAGHVRLVGLPKICLHDVRHTHATLALQASLHPNVTQEQLRRR